MEFTGYLSYEVTSKVTYHEINPDFEQPIEYEDKDDTVVMTCTEVMQMIKNNLDWFKTFSIVTKSQYECVMYFNHDDSDLGELEVTIKGIM